MAGLDTMIGNINKQLKEDSGPVESWTLRRPLGLFTLLPLRVTPWAVHCVPWAQRSPPPPQFHRLLIHTGQQDAPELPAGSRHGGCRAHHGLPSSHRGQAVATAHSSQQLREPQCVSPNPTPLGLAPEESQARLLMAKCNGSGISVYSKSPHIQKPRAKRITLLQNTCNPCGLPACHDTPVGKLKCNTLTQKIQLTNYVPEMWGKRE